MNERTGKNEMYIPFENAIEAMKEGGVIRLSTLREVDTISVQIADNGAGIPADQINKIFTPFYTTKEEGSGLGLAFAQRIVKDHGGVISVASVEGKGATFLVTLPLSREQNVESLSQQAAS